MFKLSHIHFVSHETASKRLVQMGELESSIFNIGSADLDVLFSDKLPNLETVKTYYDIPFENYAVVLFHSVTTAHQETAKHADDFVQALLEDDQNGNPPPPLKVEWPRQMHSQLSFALPGDWSKMWKNRQISHPKQSLPEGIGMRARITSGNISV